MLKQKTIPKNPYFCKYFYRYFLIYAIFSVIMAFLLIKNLADVRIKIIPKFSILKNLQENFIDFSHACGGKGRCVTCKMQVLEGENMLSLPTNAEQNFREQKLLKNTERLACQVFMNNLEDKNNLNIENDVIINIPKETQLPHLEYLD